MKQQNKKNEKQQRVVTYQAPTIEVVDIEIGQNILDGSLGDFGDGGNPPFGGR